MLLNLDAQCPGKAKKIICMCGAGLSVSAGIPDFRTPGTGLYSNLQKFDLPFPEAVFEINYFKRKPAAFFMLAKVWCAIEKCMGKARLPAGFWDSLAPALL